MTKNKNLAAIFTLLLFPFAATAGFSASYDLKLNASFDTFGRRWHSTGTIKCNPVGRGTNEDVWDPQRYLAEQSTGIISLTEANAREFETKAQYVGQSVYTPRHVRISFETKNESESAKISINEEVQLNAISQPEGECSHAEYVARTATFLTSGSIILKYKVPQNIWVLKLNTLATGDISLAQTSKEMVEGAIHVGPKLPGNERFIWVKPESEIFIKIEFKDYALGRALNGELMMKVDLPKTSVFLLENVSDTLKALQTDRALVANESLAALVNNRAMEKREFLGGAKTSQVLNTLDSLYGIASTPGGADYSWDTKASAALGAYQLAKNVLSDIAPYCTTLRIPAPLDPNRMIELKGIRYAWYFFNKAINNLTSPTYTRLMPVIRRLVQHENAGITYKQIFDDKAELGRLRDAWSATSKIHASMEPFRYAAIEISKVLQNIHVDSTTNNNLKSIVKELFSLGEMAEKLEADLDKRLDLFPAAQPNPIVISDIASRLDKIIEAQDTYAQKLRNAISLMSSENSSDANLKGIVAKLISHNVDILNKPMPDTEFEKLRSEYVGLNESQNVIKGAIQCLDEK